MTTATHKALGYDATRNDDGTLTIHRVPIFVECFREVGVDGFDGNFDADWIGKAVADAKMAARDGHFPPLHVRHHSGGEDLDVRAAGYYRVLGTEAITFKGSRRTAIMADLVITNPGVEMEILAKQLPYRSVEIPDVLSPKISSLALLDHEAPFLELPMLLVAEVEGENANRVAPATFANPWSSTDGASVLGFRAGQSAVLFFRDEAVSETTDTATEEVKPDGVNMQDDDTKEESSEDMQEDGGGIDVDAIVKAITSKEISIGDMDKLLAAIQEAQQIAETDEAPVDDPMAPAAAPSGAEAMSNTTDGKNSAKMSASEAALHGKVKALELKDKRRDERDQRKGDVAAAMKRLEDRPVGDLVKFEAELVTFHADHGPAAFKSYVDRMVATFAEVPDDLDDTDAKTSFTGGAKHSPVVMKYQSEGTDAIDQAARFSAQWRDLKEHGATRQSEENYVRVNMKRLGIEPAA